MAAMSWHLEQSTLMCPARSARPLPGACVEVGGAEGRYAVFSSPACFNFVAVTL